MFKNRSYFADDTYNHDYTTRNKMQSFQYPKHRLSLYEKSPKYKSIQMYNILPKYLRSITAERDFKREICTLLCSIEPYSLAEYMDYFKPK